MGAKRDKTASKAVGRSVKTTADKPAKRLRATRKKAATEATTASESAAQIKIERRRDLVMQYLINGAENLRAIANALTSVGYPCSHETVRQDIAAVTERLQAKSMGKLEEMRAIENGRFDYWTQQFSPMLSSKNAKGQPTEPNINAGWLLLAISSARREMNGLNKPAALDVTVNTKQALAQLIGCSPDELPDPPKTK